jgi:8-amino-7-oxononanoate synthase
MNWTAQREDLARLKSDDRLRHVVPAKGIDFSSNDYLGLAGSRALNRAAQEALERGVATGSGGSRLLRGNCPEHEALEEKAAQFFGSEAALFMPSGFAANTALLATLPQSADRIFYDKLAHASVHEGLKLARAASEAVAHNDPQAMDDGIARWRKAGGVGTPWIVAESLYSMDGDFAPLEALREVAGLHDAMLVIDEAHATGVFGNQGQGLVSQSANRDERSDSIITLHTCGKALGCEGALLCGPKLMRDHMINRARGFIFSTAPSPLMAAIVASALDIVADADDERAELNRRIVKAAEHFAELGAQCHGSPIIPLICGDNASALQLAEAVQEAGFDVRAIRPPTVPQGSSRLRIVLTLNATQDDLAGLAQVLHRTKKA